MNSFKIVLALFVVVFSAISPPTKAEDEAPLLLTCEAGSSTCMAPGRFPRTFTCSRGGRTIRAPRQRALLFVVTSAPGFGFDVLFRTSVWQRGLRRNRKTFNVEWRRVRRENELLCLEFGALGEPFSGRRCCEACSALEAFRRGMPSGLLCCPLC